MGKATKQVDETDEPMTPGQRGEPRPPRLGVRLFGLALIIFSIVVATYLLVAYFAFESGQALRTERETSSRVEQISHQILLARDDVVEGSENLALTRLEWVLGQDPVSYTHLTLPTSDLV